MKNIETTEGVASSFLERARAGRRGPDPEISGLERTVAEEDDVLSAEDALLDREVATLPTRLTAQMRLERRRKIFVNISGKIGLGSELAPIFANVRFAVLQINV